MIAFIQEYPAFAWTMLGMLVLFLPMILVSHPEWFRRPVRPQVDRNPVAENWQVLAEYTVQQEPEQGYGPIPVHFRPAPIAQLQEVNVIDEDDLDALFGIEDDPAEDEEVFVRAIDQLYHQSVAIPQPTIPQVESPTIPQPSGPIRRNGYRFSIGSDFWFSLGFMYIVQGTGKGKSNIVGLLIGQALEKGIECWYSSAGYAPVDEDGLDISPLVDRCTRVALEPSGSGQLQLLRDAVNVINERTILAQEKKIGIHAPILIFGEEIKVLQAKLNLLKVLKTPGFDDAVLESGALMEVIISSGRKFNVNFAVVSQDAQVQTVKMSQGTQNNFEVRIAHPSLDRASLANLLPKAWGKHDPLPKVSAAYDWYVICADQMGIERITVVNVPLLTNKSIQKYVESVPLRTKSVSNVPHVQPDNAMPSYIRDASPPRGMVVPEMTEAMEPEGKRVYSRRHFEVAFYLRDNPSALQSDVARKIWGRSDGPYNQRAKKYMEDVAGLVLGTPAEESETNEKDS
jgi:hypothetical protein